MKFRKREKSVLLLALTLIIVVGGAWTWDVLTQKDSDEGQIGKPVELVLEKNASNSGKLVPPQSLFANEDGYATEHSYDYTIGKNESTERKLLIDFDLSHETLDEEDTYTALEAFIVYDGVQYPLEQGLNELDITFTDSVELELVIRLNESLKGSGIGIGQVADKSYAFDIEFSVGGNQ